jgi:DNA-binding GntR family transcriptional regulator
MSSRELTPRGSGNSAALLKARPGDPAMRIRQVIYSNGKATIYGVGYNRSERHQLFIRRFS